MQDPKQPPPFFGGGFLSFASGMVRMSKESLRCLAVYLVKLKPHAKVPEVTHLFTRAQYSCALSVIITHPRVIKSTQAWNGPTHQRT